MTDDVVLALDAELLAVLSVLRKLDETLDGSAGVAFLVDTVIWRWERVSAVLDAHDPTNEAIRDGGWRHA